MDMNHEDVEKLHRALAWTIRQLEALVTEDIGNGAFIRGTGTELAGFGQRLDEARSLVPFDIRKAERNK